LLSAFEIGDYDAKHSVLPVLQCHPFQPSKHSITHIILFFSSSFTGISSKGTAAQISRRIQQANDRRERAMAEEYDDEMGGGGNRECAIC
jgi:hypothetical protein